MSYLIEDDPIKRHAMAIAYYDREIRDLNDTRCVYLSENDTTRMVAVAVAAKHQHEVWLRLYQR